MAAATIQSALKRAKANDWRVVEVIHAAGGYRINVVTKRGKVKTLRINPQPPQDRDLLAP